MLKKSSRRKGEILSAPSKTDDENVPLAVVVDMEKQQLPALGEKKKHLRCGDMAFVLWAVFTAILALTSIALHQSLAVFALVILGAVWTLVWLCSGGCNGDGISSPTGKYEVCRWGCVILFFEFFILYFFWELAAQSDPSNAFSPCGKSSCTPERNPNGWYDRTAPFMKCPYLTCRWADANDLPIQGYDSSTLSETIPDLDIPCETGDTGCANLATRRRVDYPDPGYGLSEDWFEGITTVNKLMCPWMDTAVNANDVVGQGKHVCTGCSRYMNKHYYIEMERSPPGLDQCPEGGEDDFMCYLCVDASVRQTLGERTAIWSLFIVHILATIIMMMARRCM